MGIDVESWRSTIGKFYSKTQTLRLKYIYSNFGLSDFLKWLFSYTTQVIKATSETLYSLSMSILNLEFSIVVFLLVILSGDVSENPHLQLSSYLTVLEYYPRSVTYVFRIN